MVEKVQSVVNYLVETVAIGDQRKEVKEKKKATRGSNVRKKHTAVFKAKVIHQVQPDVSQDQNPQKYGMSQSLADKLENVMCSKEKQLNVWNCIDYFLISLKQLVIKAEK